MLYESVFLYPVVVAVLRLLPLYYAFMVKYAVPFSELFAERKPPKKWVKNINRYSVNAQAIKIRLADLSAVTLYVIL